MKKQKTKQNKKQKQNKKITQKNKNKTKNHEKTFKKQKHKKCNYEHTTNAIPQPLTGNNQRWVDVKNQLISFARYTDLRLLAVVNYPSI